MIYATLVLGCITLAVFLNCAIGEDIAVVRIFLFPLVILVIAGFVVRLPLSGKHLMGRVLVACLGLAVIVVMAIHPYLLQLQFGASQSELSLVAARIAAGHEVTYPVGAGSFEILDGGAKEDGSIYLWTDLDPSGPEGFVFGYKGSGYNTWSEVRLSDDCYYICED